MKNNNIIVIDPVIIYGKYISGLTSEIDESKQGLK